MALQLSGGVQLDPAVVRAVSDVKLETAPSTKLQSYTAFDRNKHFTVGDNDVMLPWNQKPPRPPQSTSWGQFKLLVEEIQFLTLYWDPVKVPKPMLIYIGSAIGTHIDTLVRMFPNFTYNLFDPRPHDPVLECCPEVKIHQKFFTNDDAKVYAGRNDVFLIVDVRGSDYTRAVRASKEVDMANEKIAWNNMLEQQSWVKIMKPVRASLKFRLPYAHDFVKAEGPTRTYLDGLVYLQPWGLRKTSEARLVPHTDLRTREWNYENYEAMMHNHNVKVRDGMSFLNPLTDDQTPIAPKLGLYNDFDSAITTVIIMEYLAKFAVSSNRTLQVLEAVISGAGRGKVSLLERRAALRLE
jgi:hypothetical protein